MHYDWTAIPESEIPAATDPQFTHLVESYVSETNKTASMWREIPDGLLDFRPHPKCNTTRMILVHQILSERRFFAQFVGTAEPPVEDLLPSDEQASANAYIEKYVEFARRRLPQFATASSEWWFATRPFFGGLQRQRIWIFWRRVLHTCHHRTQVQSWLRMGGASFVPAIYGPSADVTWSEADPTYTVAAAGRGAPSQPQQ